MMGRFVLRNVKKAFGEHIIIPALDLDIDDGEFVVFVGPSGCGKTTLLRSISGLETVTGGKIELDGRDITYEHPSKRNVAMVFQNYALFPHLTVFENVAFGLRLQRLTKAEINQRVQRAAALLHIEPLLQRKPKQLSGGQRQRVALHLCPGQP